MEKKLIKIVLEFSGQAFAQKLIDVWVTKDLVITQEEGGKTGNWDQTNLEKLLCVPGNKDKILGYSIPYTEETQSIQDITRFLPFFKEIWVFPPKYLCYPANTHFTVKKCLYQLDRNLCSDLNHIYIKEGEYLDKYLSKILGITKIPELKKHTRKSILFPEIEVEFVDSFYTNCSETIYYCSKRRLDKVHQENIYKGIAGVYLYPDCDEEFKSLIKNEFPKYAKIIINIGNLYGNNTKLLMILGEYLTNQCVDKRFNNIHLIQGLNSTLFLFSQASRMEGEHKIQKIKNIDQYKKLKELAKTGKDHYWAILPGKLTSDLYQFLKGEKYYLELREKEKECYDNLPFIVRRN